MNTVRVAVSTPNVLARTVIGTLRVPPAPMTELFGSVSWKSAAPAPVSVYDLIVRFVRAAGADVSVVVLSSVIDVLRVEPSFVSVFGL